MMGVAAPPDGYSVAGTIPVEQSITYKDFSGAVLKTVAKAWFTATRLGCELTQYGSVISGQWYTYNTVGQLTDEKDYDYGQITALSACNSTSGVPSAPPTGVMPVREKAITYQTFGSSPIFGSPVITNRPSSIITYGSGTRLAERDYTYDTYVGGIGPLTALSHDDTNYPATYTNRGNLTGKVDAINRIIQKSYAGVATPTVKYGYDGVAPSGRASRSTRCSRALTSTPSRRPTGHKRRD